MVEFMFEHPWFMALYLCIASSAIVGVASALSNIGRKK